MLVPTLSDQLLIMNAKQRKQSQPVIIVYDFAGDPTFARRSKLLRADGPMQLVCVEALKKTRISTYHSRLNLNRS